MLTVISFEHERYPTVYGIRADDGAGMFRQPTLDDRSTTKRPLKATIVTTSSGAGRRLDKHDILIDTQGLSMLLSQSSAMVLRRIRVRALDNYEAGIVYGTFLLLAKTIALA